MKRFFFGTALLFLIANCRSTQLIHEPNLDRIIVKSKAVCIAFSLNPFCYEGKSNSLMIHGSLNNSTGAKKYVLDYYLDNFDSDLPVGVSLKIDDKYYVLPRLGTDYSDFLKISSELKDDVVKKFDGTKSLEISYSNRRDTKNIVFSRGERDSFQQIIKDVVEQIDKTQKMEIVR